MPLMSNNPTFPSGSSALYTLPSIPNPIRFSCEKLFVYCWRDAMVKDFAKVGGAERFLEGLVLAPPWNVVGSTITLSAGASGGGGGGGGIEYASIALISISWSTSFGIVPILCTSFSCSSGGFGIAPILLVSAWWSSFGLTAAPFGTTKKSWKLFRMWNG